MVYTKSTAAGTDPEQPPGLQANREPETPRREVITLSKIVVTGTHIADETPVGSSLSVHTRDEIERSGSATLDQFGRKMTENYSGTDSLSTLNTNGNLGVFEQGAASNVFGGAGFNLKGLGPGSTLTLMNGHRLAAGGLDGATVDISQIPLSAIDHIEVLDDGVIDPLEAVDLAPGRFPGPEVLGQAVGAFGERVELLVQEPRVRSALVIVIHPRAKRVHATPCLRCASGVGDRRAIRLG